MTEPSEDRRRWVLEEIARDAEADVHRFEGRPFTGKTVAEYMACQAAAIVALAEVVATLLPPETPDRECGPGTRKEESMTESENTATAETEAEPPAEETTEDNAAE